MLTISQTAGTVNLFRETRLSGLHFLFVSTLNFALYRTLRASPERNLESLSGITQYEHGLRKM